MRLRWHVEAYHGRFPVEGERPLDIDAYATREEAEAAVKLAQECDRAGNEALLEHHERRLLAFVMDVDAEEESGAVGLEPPPPYLIHYRRKVVACIALDGCVPCILAGLQDEGVTAWGVPCSPTA